MKKIISYLALWLCAGLLVAGCSKDSEKEVTGTINGFVSDYANANAPIAGVTVTLNMKGLTKTTGSDGRYEFRDLEPGTYSLSFVSNNYQSTTKQVTVHAGQTAICDAQLDRASAMIDINPRTLVFGKDIDQASISIVNNSNNSFAYSFSNCPDYIKVTPISGTIAAKGQQAISISINNRKAINEEKNGQMTLNVGSDSYTISFTIEPYQAEGINIDVSPQSLSFDKDTEQLTFSITNNSNRSVDYSVSSNLDILTVTPSAGTLDAGAKNTVTVAVTDRKAVTEKRTGQVTITVEGNTFVVAVSVDKYEEGGSGVDPNPNTNPEPGEISTTRGLLAYYTFDNDNADNAYRDNDHGYIVEKASFITDTPNGKGKALSLERGSFVNIPSNLLDEKNTFTVSLWLKDFGAGFIFRTEYEWGYFIDQIPISSPSIYVNNEDKLDISYSKYGWKTSKFSIKPYQSPDWHMLTVVWDSSAEKMLIYLDGKRVDSIGESGIYSQGESMQIGGTDPMKTDNVRIHSVALSDAEVAEIYAAESKK